MSSATMKAEADALERGAEILKSRLFSSPGPTPAVCQLEQALEILLRKEAARVRFKLHKRESAMAGIFPESLT